MTKLKGKSDSKPLPDAPIPQDKELLQSHIYETVTKIAANMERTQIADYVLLLNSPRKLIVRNVVAGIARGVGIAIGFTVFAATIVYVLRQLGALDLPIIGDYIADIVRIVQAQLEGRAF